MTTAPDKILVKISEEVRKLVFGKQLLSPDGQKFWMVTKIKEEEGFDEFFAQGVSVGEVISVGEHVNNIRIGDTVILDYIVDVSHTFNVVEKNDYKIVAVTSVTTYMKDDLIVPAHRNKPRPTIVHKKGELDEGALVLAVVRDNVIIPNPPYIFMEYKEENVDEFFKKEGQCIWSRSKREPIVERKVLFVHPQADVSPGETVLLEEEAVFSRSLGDSRFDVAYEFDIIAIELQTVPPMRKRAKEKSIFYKQKYQLS